MSHQLTLKIDNPNHSDHARYHRAVNRCTLVVVYALLSGLLSLDFKLLEAALLPALLVAAFFHGLCLVLLFGALIFMPMISFWKFLMGH